MCDVSGSGLVGAARRWDDPERTREDEPERRDDEAPEGWGENEFECTETDASRDGSESRRAGAEPEGDGSADALDELSGRLDVSTSAASRSDPLHASDRSDAAEVSLRARARASGPAPAGAPAPVAAPLGAASPPRVVAAERSAGAKGGETGPSKGETEPEHGVLESSWAEARSPGDRRRARRCADAADASP